MSLVDWLKIQILKYVPRVFLLPIREFHYTRSLKFYDYTKEPDIQVIRFLVKTGDTVIDIGANIGVYTNYLSKLVGLTGKVFSIEPISDTRKFLATNVNRLELSNVKIIGCAIAAEDGIAQMGIPQYQDGGRIYTNHISFLQSTVKKIFEPWK